MSSQQISEQPLPPEKKRCPHCGEIMPADAPMCWLCLEKFSVREGDPPVPAVSQDEPAKRQNKASWRILGALMIVICLSLAYEAPGILIVLLVAAVPAVVRTAMLSAKQKSPGVSVIGTFLGALGVAVLVGLAASIAFFATCFVVCLVGLPVNEHFNHKGGYEGITVVSIGAGLVPGIAVAIYLFKAFWTKKG